MRLIKQAFGESYHPYNMHTHPCINLYLIIQSTIMNVALVQTLLLAHLNRRFIGELIVYKGIRRPSVRPSSVRLSTFSNDISSEAVRPILSIFHI